jgi:hypothetical protein
MDFNDYFTRVKNFADDLTSIRALGDDDDLMAMTLNGVGKYYSQFQTSITIQKTFFNFQELITLFISEEMKIVGTSMEDHKKMFSTQILIEVEVKVVKPHLKVNTETCMADIINMKVDFMEVDEETLEEEEVVEAVVEIIEVNDQITIQIITIAGYLNTWQIIVIKGNMMHGMESYNKGIMHQLVIKVMSNCL